jgi:hypothetical protein
MKDSDRGDFKMALGRTDQYDYNMDYFQIRIGLNMPD